VIAATIIKEKKGTIIDVRTSEEFVAANAVGSINIPLQELELHIDALKAMNKPLVLCCATGSRSGLAILVLQRQGIECYNAGSWLNVNKYQL
jgi:phage shock protein E